MSPKEQKNIFVDKRGTKLKPQKRQNTDFLIVIATTYLLHREIGAQRAKSPQTSTVTNTLTIKQRISGQGALKILQIHMILRQLGQVLGKTLPSCLGY